MSEASTSLLTTVLFFLLLLSAFFSSSETGMMAINRYRLRHLVKKGHKAALRTSNLLDRPDRLIGVILIGNNFVNILASALATIIAVRLWGEDSGIAIATLGLTVFVLIFGEVTPKTVAAMFPEKVAFPASLVLFPLLKLLYPMVVALNWICGLLLKPFGIRPGEAVQDQLNAEELRTIVTDPGMLLPQKRRGMLLGILDLEKVRVDDIMVPRNEVLGIDIEDDIKDILDQLRDCQHTRVPVFKGDVNNLVGMLHMRKVARLLSEEEVNKAMLLQETTEPYYVPESTPLHTQLFNFQKTKERVALVVDEYGDVMGLVTLEDILEEIVGDFTTDVSDSSQDITPQEDGTYIIDGSASVRDINKILGWSLPTEDARTINGLITEQMEFIPESSVCLKVGIYRLEIMQMQDNRVKSVRMFTADQWKKIRKAKKK
ncbi:magnesium/cobalt efflux protein [Endozoicomonas sp. OPT23]|uniref:HlyC/CorC family transporter n=1 Tax=Endozoicomonas sp. OPT23 TaxID=2072845 RepID=UPI00129BB213|nr:HlyC/CorC family transporter [Endozoicomonas sp. OPT23]MRI34526.1 magnesium/cobalt efflux protein [Endozoicomonas sp. OPT23]